MTTLESHVQVLPYSRVVGQEQLKLALELAYVSPNIGGVLLSGERGTGKSTSVRAFAQMVSGKLPVTLPINATEDRVVGGWDVDQLMSGQAKPLPGLLEQARGSILYIDEVNLLDDHIVNIILDVTSTGVMVVQREGIGKEEVDLRFTLVGTMNPEEGILRPQLIDRFGLAVNVTTARDEQQRALVLQTMLDYDRAKFKQEQGQVSTWLEEAQAEDAEKLKELGAARDRAHAIEVSDVLLNACINIATNFDVAGHRAEYTLALAARAYAAIQDKRQATLEHVLAVSPLVMQHRRRGAWQTGQLTWSAEDNLMLQESLKNAPIANDTE